MPRHASVSATRKPARCYLATAPAPGEWVALTTRQYRHWISALRRGHGDPVTWFDGVSRHGTGTLEGSDKTGFGIRIETAQEFVPIPPDTLTLWLGLPKLEQVPTCLELATIAGATRIIAFPAARTPVKLSHSKWAMLTEKWTAVLSDTAEQCGRLTLPRLAIDPADTPLEPGTDLWLAQSLEEVTTSPLPLLDSPSPGARVTLIVGPEGGFTAPELDVFAGLGAVAWHLPGATLTTVAACGILPALWRWSPQRTCDFPALAQW